MKERKKERQEEQERKTGVIAQDTVKLNSAAKG
jgi:hypothetical protein